MNTSATVTSLRSVGPPTHSASAEVANINGRPRSTKSRTGQSPKSICRPPTTCMKKSFVSSGCSMNRNRNTTTKTAPPRSHVNPEAMVPGARMMR